MEWTLLIVSFLGIAGFLAVRARLPFYEIGFAFCASCALFLYGCGLGGVLAAGPPVFMGLGIILGAIALYQGRARLWSVVPIGAVSRSSALGLLTMASFAVPFLGLYALIPNDYLFTAWDEFSFWGTSIKIIHAIDALYQADSPTVFKHYPPAQQMFQYYLVHSAGWSEKNVLFAQGFFVLSCLMSAAGSLVRRNEIRLALFLIFIPVLYFFRYSLSAVLVDPLLSACFVAALALAIKPDKSKAEYALILLAAPTLVLIKEIGLLLSGIAFGAFAVSEIAKMRSSSRTPMAIFRGLAPCILFLVAVLVAYETWQHYVQSIGAAISHDLPTPSYFLSGGGQARFNATAAEVISKMLETHGGFLSILGFVVILTGLGGLCVALEKTIAARVEAGLHVATLFSGFWLYLGFLFISYLVFFTENEGVRAASFARYISTYLFAWAALTIVLLVRGLERRNEKRALAIVAVLLVAALVCAPSGFRGDIRGIQSIPEILDSRKKVDALADVVKKRIQPNEKAYFIIQNSTGFEKYAFNYAMLPNPSVWWCWSLGKKYSENDLWTCDKKLADVLDGYQYLVLYHADRQFWDDNGALFDASARGKTTGVFAVRREGPRLSLEEIQ
jgi:hypothetical protein